MASAPPYPGAPRWAEVFGTITLVVILLFAVLMLTRGHGRHGSPGGGHGAPRWGQR
jgi:hypothetical protein